MKHYTVRVTKMAYNHMSEITNYIANELFAPEASIKLINHLQGTIEGLAEMPERYQLVDEDPWRTEGIRKITVKNFLIYFWIDEPNEKVQIIGVIYSRRNQVAQLAKLDKE